MENITSKTHVKDKIEIVGQKEIEKQEKLIGRVNLKRGHTLFEINLKEHTIEPAEFEEQAIIYPKGKSTPKGLGIVGYKDGSKKVILDKAPTHHQKLIRKQNCIYIPALNRKNVIKKLVKRGIVKLKNK